MYSKIHLAHFLIHPEVSELIPSGVIVTISPGSTSLTNSAPIAENAQVSEDTKYALSLFPILNGLKPKTSLAAINLRGLITTREYAPFIFFMALATAASTLEVLRRSLAM